MRKFKFCIFSCVVLLCVACTAAPSIEGYWLSEFNESLAFSSDGKVTVNGTPGTYSIYDENKIQIICEDILSSFSFNGSFQIENEILYLTDLDTGITYAYYGNEETQSAIRQSIADSEEEQRRIDEAEKVAQEAAEKTEKQIASIKDQISRIETEIQLLENQIQSCYEHIDTATYSISLRYEDISNYESNLQEDISEENREYIQGLISDKYDTIADLEEEIVGYQNQIADLESEITAYEKEIEELKQTLSQYE